MYMKIRDAKAMIHIALMDWKYELKTEKECADKIEMVISLFQSPVHKKQLAKFCEVDAFENGMLYSKELLIK